MTVTQAIAIFRASKWLAAVLLGSWVNPPLYPHESEILIELQKVVDAGLTQESWIYELAGLDYMEFNVLLARLDYHHARGEDTPMIAPAIPLAQN